MNVLFISIDSLRRDFLGAYRDVPRIVDYEVATPNLDRFAEQAAVFESHYAGSLPCMPARREWLTGTQEFLWRPWGPIEPFDTPLPAALRREGFMTKLVTDHYHYFQHGSGGYFEDFNGYEFVRGHEYDAWRTAPRDPGGRARAQMGFSAPDDPEGFGYLNPIQYARNAATLDEEADFFAPQVFSSTAAWLRRNQEWDDWFAYVDSFDVHEPFHVPEPYATMYTDEDPTDPTLTHWPPYGRIDRGQGELSGRELAYVQSQFAAKVTMVDEWFGRVLDVLDETDSWDETAVIVTSDHGYYLGDHGWSGKPFGAPMYDVLAHTPLLVWHPESPRMGDRISALTAAVDLYATILDVAGVACPDTRHSRSLLPLLGGSGDAVRDWALYGYWGSSVNVTDGRWTYLHPCDEAVDAECYSTQMINPHSWFTPPEPQPTAEGGSFLPFTDCPVWRYPASAYSRHEEPFLFDTGTDPEQTTDQWESASADGDRLRTLLCTALGELRAPEIQYERLRLDTESHRNSP